MYDLERPAVPGPISELAESGWQRIGPQAEPLSISIIYRAYSRMRAVQLTAHRFAPHLPVYLGLQYIGVRDGWEITGPGAHAAAFTAAARAAESEHDPATDAAQTLAAAGWHVIGRHDTGGARAWGPLYAAPSGVVVAERIGRSRPVGDGGAGGHWVIRHSDTSDPTVAHPATPGAVLIAYLLTLAAT